MSHRALGAVTVGVVTLVLFLTLADSSPPPGITVPPRADPPPTTSTSDATAVGPVAETATGVPSPERWPGSSPAIPTDTATTATPPSRNTAAAPSTPAGRTSTEAPPNVPTTAGVRTIVCPDPRAAVEPVPAPARAEVDRELAAMGTQVADANRRLRTQDNPSDPNFVQNAILGPLTSQRIASLDRIAIAIGRYGPRPSGLDRFATCAVTRT